MADGQPGARPPATAGKFEHDTAVRREGGGEGEVLFSAEVAPDWLAGRGPHGGYIAAMLMRALIETVADPERAPRSLTIHYARAPTTGPVQIRTVLEREGRSLSTLSARMEQEGKLIALVLSAFSVPWPGPEISDLAMPVVAPPEGPDAARGFFKGAPLFTNHILLEPRLEGDPFGGGEQPMEVLAWIGLREERPLDAPTLAFFADALMPAPFMRVGEPLAAPTIDLTVHFRAPLSAARQGADPGAMVLAMTRTHVVHDGFFEEDGWIWAPDGTLLAQSRQLAILLPFSA